MKWISLGFILFMTLDSVAAESGASLQNRKPATQMPELSTETTLLPKPSPLPSPTPSSTPTVDIHGIFWGQYTYEGTENSVHHEGFDVTRAFLQFNYNLDPTWSSTILLDGQRGETISVKGGTGTTVNGGVTKANLWGYVRNAFIQAASLCDGNGTFRFGLQPTLYVGLIDSTNKTRWLGKSLLDQATLVPTQDAGASFTGNITSNFKYGLMVHDGIEGINRPGNQDSGLSASFIATFYPVKGFGMTLYQEYQGNGKSAPGVINVNGFRMTTFATTVETSFINATAEFTTQQDYTLSTPSNGAGVMADIRPIGPKSSMYLRYFSGNTQFQTQKLLGKSVITVGPTFSFVPGRVSTALLYEARPQTIAGTPTVTAVMWNWAINF